MTTTFLPQHVGLYFGQDDLAQVQARREASSFALAWSQLDADTPPFTDAMSTLIWQAMCYRLNGHADAGARAVQHLQTVALASGTDAVALTTLLGQMHAFEMVREHEAWGQTQGAWLERLFTTLEAILSTDETRPVEWYWRIPLRLGGAIVLEDEGAFAQGCADFESAIKEYLHTEGYLKNAVMLKDGKSFERQQLGIKALVLGAEMARVAGHDLWEYDNRGVSLATGVAYQVYYYFFPDKWRWEEEGTYDEAFMHEAFTRGGAYIEIATQRVKPRNVEFLLEERRPFFDALGGGATTLTHGIAGQEEKRKRRGWFG